MANPAVRPAGVNANQADVSKSLMTSEKSSLNLKIAEIR